MIAETGTHVMAAADLAQVEYSAVNMTWQAQGEYLSQAVQQTLKGTRGFQVFKLSDNGGFAAPSGGYSKQDVSFLQACTNTIVQSSIRPLLEWAASLRDVRYLLSGRAAEVL